MTSKQLRELESAPKRTAGWISRHGKLYPCGVEGHTALAAVIAQLMWRSTAGERILAYKGWARLYYTGQLYLERSGAVLGPLQVKLIEQLVDADNDEHWKQNLQRALADYGAHNGQA